MATRHPDTLFVIDEAYWQFVDGMASAVEIGLANVLVLRSMTKDYALAGLRLGYVLGDADLVAGLARAQVPWSVSEVAQVAGVVALAAQAAYEAQWVRLREVADCFKRELSELGFRPNPSPMHYFLMRVGDGVAFREKLLQQGLLVRLCESYGLPEFVRVSTQTPEQNALLLAALRGVN